MAYAVSPIKADQRKGCVALIGLPGTGKSTVGKLLADELGWAFFDCDALFEANAGTDIAGWVAEHGWTAFREHEGVLVASVLAHDGVVIATGGGVVEDEKNCDMLSALAMVVWLYSSLEVLAARVGSAASRPLLTAAPHEGLRELAQRRNPLYAMLADLRVDADASDPEQIAVKIKRELALRGYTRKS